MLDIKQIFRKDSEGNTLFFPWGPFSSGYIVDDETIKKRIISKYELHLWLSLAWIPVVFIIFFMFQNNLVVIFSFLFLSIGVTIGIVYVSYQPLLQKLRPSAIKLRVGDNQVYMNSGLNLKKIKWLVILMVLGSFIFTGYSFFEQAIMVPLLGVSAMMLLTAVVYWKMYTQLDLQERYPENYTLPLEYETPPPVENMKFTPKNIGIILIVILVIFGAIYWGINDAQEKENTRNHLYETMDTNTYATYLATRNKKGGHYDNGATIFSTEAVKNQFILNLVLKESTDLEVQKRKYRSSLRRQACRSKAMGGFFKKGGANHYRFYETEEVGDMLFEVVLTKEDCSGY